MSGHPTEFEDRAAIHALLMEYGAALDRRDFDAFGRLFGADGIYGTLETGSVGPAAGPMMKERYENGSNVIHVPNLHLFFNEIIWFETPEKARSTSACMFMTTPDQETRKLTIGVAATYDDELVKEADGTWRFARRTLKPFTNGPTTPAE